VITTETLTILICTAAGGLTVGSFLALKALRVFAPGPLVGAPPRHSTLSLLHVGGLLGLYLVASVLALVATGYKGPAGGAAPTITQFTHIAAVDTLVRILMIGMMIALAYWLTYDRLEGWGLSWNRLPGGVTLGLLATALMAPPIFLVMQATDLVIQALHRASPVHEVLRILQDHPPIATSALLLFSAAILAPIAEELFFRGILQTALIQWNPFSLGFAIEPPLPGFRLYPNLPAGPQPELVRSSYLPAPSAARRWVAILISSTLFTLVHGQVEFFPVLMVLALALGYLYERTGNLWASITLHAAFNSTSLALTLCLPASPS
jgi:membrane protease YdiL (CAAX protease family)